MLSTKEIITIVCQTKGFPEKMLLTPSRNQAHRSVRDMVTYLSVKHCKDNLESVAKKLNASPSTLSRARHAFLVELTKSKKLQNEVKDIEEALN